MLSHYNIDETNAQLPYDNFPHRLDNLHVTKEVYDPSTATGPHGTSRKKAGCIVPSLTKLMNMSLSLSEGLSEWKIANNCYLRKVIRLTRKK